jgi:hypothetical protein
MVAILLQQVIVMATDKPLSMRDIWAISPRFMTQQEVEASISLLLNRGMLEKHGASPNSETLYYWSDYKKQRTP